MTDKLAKQSNALVTTGKQSSQDLVLGKMLMLSAQVMGRDLMPGEIRLWSETFAGVNPSTLERAFRDYLKTGKFFPKPGDIWECIENIRGEIREDKEKSHRSELEREQESKEWQAVSLKARQTLAAIAEGSFNPTRNTRDKLKAQAAELLAKRQSTSTAPDTSEST